MNRSSGSGLPINPPSHRVMKHNSDSLGFRSLYGCGAAGDLHPSSTHPSVFGMIPIFVTIKYIRYSFESREKFMTLFI